MKPVEGKISSHYGKRTHPITGLFSFHNGVDIACKTGSPVVAPDFGKITEVWTHERGGKSLAMVSNSGVRYGFAHLSDWKVQPGQPVVEGQLIALSGNTGRTTGPHLHFTVRIKGSFVDPLKYFKY